jgi:two-component system response regulator GlrR
MNAMLQVPKRKARILAVDDDPGLLRLLTIRLRAENYEVEAVESGAQALSATSRFRPDLVITDLRMDEMDGIGLLKELQSRYPGLKVIMLTAHGTIPDAVQATQMGAFGFLTKPVDKQELLDQVQKALRISGFSENAEEWRSEIVTRSAVMEERLAQAHMVAGTDARVLITGESGTGKELLARAIHKASPRRNKPFVAINCSAMSEELLESELFGHERGSFTGAVRQHRGLFQSADGGTLLLDEIGDMPARLQVKLLRVLQENAIRPVGSTESIPVNVRVISATHRDLQQLMAAGQFREDLYYRLNVFPILVPPLRDRKDDIAALVSHFITRIAAEEGRKVRGIDGRALTMLQRYAWPGNVRQLENTVFRAIVLCESDTLTVQDFPQIASLVEGYDVEIPAAPALAAPAAATQAPRAPGAQVADGSALGISIVTDGGHIRKLEDVEADMIRLALHRYRGQMSEVARKLGIGRSTLYRKMKDFGLEEGVAG